MWGGGSNRLQRWLHWAWGWLGRYSSCLGLRQDLNCWARPTECSAAVGLVYLAATLPRLGVSHIASGALFRLGRLGVTRWGSGHAGMSCTAFPSSRMARAPVAPRSHGAALVPNLPWPPHARVGQAAGQGWCWGRLPWIPLVKPVGQGALGAR